MIILDTDMLSIAQHPDSAAGKVLQSRLALQPDSESVSTTIVTYEEQTRGWFAVMAKARTLKDQIEAYWRLYRHLLAFRRINIVMFEDKPATIFQELRSRKIRIGTMDLKIASVALANEALLLSRNLGDFKRVPGLRVEDWTKP